MGLVPRNSKRKENCGCMSKKFMILLYGKGIKTEVLHKFVEVKINTPLDF